MSDRVALVTGAATGIGKSIAQQLAADGFSIMIHHAPDQEAAALDAAGAIDSAGGRARVCAADLRHESAATTVVETTLAAFGRLDVLVSNAGVYEQSRLEELTTDHLRSHFEVNTFAPLRLAQAAAPHLQAQGRIIFITSGLARWMIGGCAAYAASKAATEAIARVLAAELGPRGVNVNAVAPGIVESDMLRRNLNDAGQKALIARTARRRIGQPADIAQAVALLCSPGAAWITGQVIDVDGGLGD